MGCPESCHLLLEASRLQHWPRANPTIAAGCTGCTLQIEGTLKVSDDTDYWEGRKSIFGVNGITGLTIYSSTGTGLIDGNGQVSTT